MTTLAHAAVGADSSHTTHTIVRTQEPNSCQRIPGASDPAAHGDRSLRKRCAEGRRVTVDDRAVRGELIENEEYANPIRPPSALGGNKRGTMRTLRPRVASVSCESSSRALTSTIARDRWC